MTHSLVGDCVKVRTKNAFLFKAILMFGSANLSFKNAAAKQDLN